jgi:hypothetical protein
MIEEQTTTRGRSVPHTSPYRVTALLSLLYYLTLVGLFTSLVMLVRKYFLRHGDVTDLLALFLCFILASVIIWITSYIQRRSVKCPLCKGTPLLDTAAAKHIKARRIWPLNYGTTAVLRVTFTQSFRCMYCGTPYDLTRKPSHRIRVKRSSR